MVPTCRSSGGWHALNLLQLGDEEAHYLGVDVPVQRILLLCSALLVAAAVAVSGVIGFVGLVVPHLMRMWLGPTTGP
jgi:iron complex transport system permease protein